MRCISVLFFLLCLCHNLSAHQEAGEERRKTLLATIPKNSLRKLLLFATLYPNTKEGKTALDRAFAGLTHEPCEKELSPFLLQENVTQLASFVEPSLSSQKPYPTPVPEALEWVKELSKNLPHKTLKGHAAQSLKEIEPLESKEIDLGRALLLLEQELSPEKPLCIDSVEASLDLLALSLLARLGKETDPLIKIRELNTLLFDELAIRFPPQSEVDEKVQQFSELSSVLFSRRGVCLGASTLYLALAQRIGLPLSIYTPPGHIFVGYKNQAQIRVIETTARGMDIPVEKYLGTSLRSLPERSLKEVIGMVAYNRASKALSDKNWKEAYRLYNIAARFAADEELAQALSMTELLLGNKKASMERANKAFLTPSPHKTEQELMLIDLKNGVVSKETVETILETTSHDIEKLPEQIKKLERCCTQDSRSLALLLHLACSWTSYGKSKEALPYLEKLATFQDASASVHLFLAELYAHRMNIPAAWREARKAALLAKAHKIFPNQLKECLLFLQEASPHCEDLSDLLYTS